MKYFTLFFVFLFSVTIVDLVGQTPSKPAVTVIKTSKGCFNTPQCVQSFFQYEENAKALDTVRAVSTYKCVDEENNLVIHVASWGGDYFVYVNHNGDADWYPCEVLFNTNGIYQITLMHTYDNSYLATVTISNGLNFNWKPNRGAGFSIKLGFPVYSCWSDLKETGCKSYYSLFYKPNAAPQKTN
jgi:hypothetical protein